MERVILLLILSLPGLLADDLQSDLEVIYGRRLEELVNDNHDLNLATQWSNQITKQGIWSDVDYTSGCPARRAVWPAQDHFHRIITMASVWYRNQSDRNLFNKINLALNWWFDRDFTEPDCINGGGQDHLNCPCGTPGMWNTNWYCQVHRGSDYIVTLKMYSNRTTNSDCNNSQNPYGFHLSDGVIYTYRSGHEYTDIYGAWDWNLTPGSTVDYGVTPLECNRVHFEGIEDFVGGAALGNAGVAVMAYTNPITLSLRWLKTYFFFPNAYVVQFVGNALSSNTSPIHTTLEQLQLSGPVYIDGVLMTETRVNTIASTLWHDRIRYEFVRPVNLTVDTSERQADWPAIGVSLGNEIHSIFVAYFTHTPESENDDSFDYIVHIDVDEEMFSTELTRLSSVQLGGEQNLDESTMEAVVRGASFGDANDLTSDRYMSLVFLSAGEFLTRQDDIRAVTTDAPAVLQFQRVDNSYLGWKMAVADPTQQLSSIQVAITLSGVSYPIVFEITLSSGSWAGSATVVEF